MSMLEFPCRAFTKVSASMTGSAATRQAPALVTDLRMALCTATPLACKTQFSLLSSDLRKVRIAVFLKNLFFFFFRGARGT